MALRILALVSCVAGALGAVFMIAPRSDMASADGFGSRAARVSTPSADPREPCDVPPESREVGRTVAETEPTEAGEGPSRVATGYLRAAPRAAGRGETVSIELRRTSDDVDSGDGRVVARVPWPGGFAVGVPDGDVPWELRARSDGAVSEWVELGHDPSEASVDVGCLLLVPDGALEGRVVDRYGGPVSDASVLVDGRRVARSDVRGRFRVETLFPGTVSVRVEHPAFAFPPPTELEVVPDRASPVLEIVGTPAHRLAVRVTDADGVPIVRAGVTLTSDRNGDSRFGTTDEGGGIRLGVGGPRPLTLRVSRRGYETVTRFDPPPDGVIAVTLRTESGVVITGRDEHGRVALPLGVRMERWSDRRGRFQATWRAAPMGRHERVLAPLTKTGRYRVVAWGVEGIGCVEWTSDRLPGATELRAVEWTIAPARPLPVDVADATGRPVPEARVLVVDGDRVLETLVADDAGRCEVQRRPLVEASDPALIVRAERFVTTRRIDVDPFVERLELRLDSGGEVTGVVIGEAGAPLPNAQVGLVVEAEGIGPRLRRSDAHGRFRFEAVPVGAARVAASYSRGGVLALLSAGGSGTRLEVPPDGGVECDVPIVGAPPSPVEVLVRENGAPVEGGHFVVAHGPCASSGADWTTHVRADGLGVLSDVPPAGSTLVVYRGGPHPLASRLVDVGRARSSGRIEIELETADVVGRVLDARGEPADGVLVEALLRVVERVGDEPGWRPVVRAVTTRDGTYRLAGVPSGTARLRFGGGDWGERTIAVSGPSELRLDPTRPASVGDDERPAE
ncbi:MAG: carboxypeptidase regulatory-like domain-containing protein [Planctomycetota bacterium JB042]